MMLNVTEMSAILQQKQATTDGLVEKFVEIKRNGISSLDPCEAGAFLS